MHKLAAPISEKMASYRKFRLLYDATEESSACSLGGCLCSGVCRGEERQSGVVNAYGAMTRNSRDLAVLYAKEGIRKSYLGSA